MIYPRTPQDPEQVGRHYDALDAFYREVWGDHVHHGLWLERDESDAQAVRNLITYALGFVDLKPDVCVCDIGCGYGATAHLLASEFGARVTGLTVSERQHEYAVDRYGSDRCTFLVRDWMANELEASAFDVLIAIESLSHMPDKARFFREGSRVLRPGGRLVVTAWLADGKPGRFQRRHLLEPICEEGRLPSMPDATEVRTCILEQGLQIDHAEMLTARVQRTWSVCLRRLGKKILTDRRYQRYLLDSRNTDRRFLLAIFRILAAYRIGAMEYGLFVARKPA